MYYIVNRIELINGVMNYTPVGYITITNDSDTINQNYESTLGQWIRDNIDDLVNNNISLSSFFNITPMVYNCYQTTTSIDGMNLSLIEDINNIE